MNISIVAFIVIGVIVLMYQYWPKSGEIRTIQSWINSKGGKDALIERRMIPEGEYSGSHYKVMYLDEKMCFHECLLEISVGSVLCKSDCSIGLEASTGILNSNLRMDCRKCGVSIESGKNTCDYCRSPRKSFSF